MKKLCLPFLVTAGLVGCGSGAQNMTTHSNVPPAAPTAKGQSVVHVSAPANNSNVATSVQYVATATTSCAAGVSKMAVYTDPNTLAYSVNGGSLNTSLMLSPGDYSTTVKAWDNCGGSGTVPVAIHVKAPQYPAAPTPPGSQTFSNLQKGPGWSGYGLLPTSYAICSSCQSGGPQVKWSSSQGVTSPSITGSAMQFNLGGQTQFADALWNNHLVGDFSSHGLFDPSQSLTSSVHNFIYDVYFYVSDLSASQAVEFDINQFLNGQSYIWGHECRIAGGNQWDIWDDQGMKWHPTGVGCWPKGNAWNHLVLQVQRTSDGHLLFQSITLNGQTATLNYYESPTSTSWRGITINYQMDGNQWQAPYTVYLDQLNFTYW
jgi:hypothetical protein